MNSVQMGICQRQAEEAALQTPAFPLHTHPIQAHPFLFIKVKESLRIKRPQVRILLGAPQTVDVLRAVGGFSFVVSKQFFLILLDFLNLTSRSAPSCQEGAPRLFSLWSRSILVVLIKMGDLAQIMAQNLFRGCRFFLAPPVFFCASLWHRVGTNRLIPP